MKTLAAVLMASVSLALCGCLGPVIEGAHEGYQASTRSDLEPKAEAGDANAQYKLGLTYCCETGPEAERSISAYDNQKATLWLCKAALQNDGEAQLKLARIYSGDKISGLRLTLRATALLGSNETSLPIAWLWASKAANDHAMKDAVEIRDSVAKKMSPQQTADAKNALADWRNAPCLWNDVMKPASADAR